MRQQVGDPALAPEVINQVALVHAIDARGQVLEPQVSQLIAARDQEMILGVMANAGELACLPDDPAVQLDDLGAELEGRGRFRHHVQEGRRVRPGCKWDRPHVFTGDQRGIGQVGERYGLERGKPVLVLPALERRREPPLRRQPQS